MSKRAERASKATKVDQVNVLMSEQCKGTNEQASDPVLVSGFLVILDHGVEEVLAKRLGWDGLGFHPYG